MRASSRRVALGVGTLLVLMISGRVVAIQYSPPWADVFSFAYPNDFTGKGLFTKVSGDNAIAQLSPAGYHTFDDNLVSAASSMNASYGQSDAIWAHLGHGRAGAALFWNGTQYSELLADTTVSPLSSSWGKAYLGSTSGLGDIRLMVFGECHTANNGGSGLYLGNLLSNAAALGVDSSIGFSDFVYWPAMDYWSTQFFSSLKNSRTINQAAVDAQGYVLYALGGGYFGTDSWATRGGTKKIVPAGYGT